MQREIKFRAWVDSNKEMVSPYFFVNDENFITQYGSSKPSAVMQFTGLKDKNGAEIYEGDIVKTYSCKWALEVIFRNSCFCIKSVRGSVCDLYELAPVSTQAIEIIGNIYESPELINS